MRTICLYFEIHQIIHLKRHRRKSKLNFVIIIK